MKNNKLLLTSYFIEWTLLFFLSLSVPISAQGEWVIPELTSPVMDQAQFLSDPVRQQLIAALKYLSHSSETQLQILIVPDLGGLNIEQAAIQVVDKWKLGKEKTDQGVLLLIAAQERKLRIEVGQGLEGDLPDALAKRIIDETVVPLFRRNHRDAGVILGVLAIVKYTNPQVHLENFFGSQAQVNPNNSIRSIELSWQGKLFFLILFILLLVFFIRHPFLFLLLLSGGRSRGGWGGGSGGSGGGWSGGGGGFSGGGASGSW